MAKESEKCPKISKRNFEVLTTQKNRYQHLLKKFK